MTLLHSHSASNPSESAVTGLQGCQYLELQNQHLCKLCRSVGLSIENIDSVTVTESILSMGSVTTVALLSPSPQCHSGSRDLHQQTIAPCNSSLLVRVRALIEEIQCSPFWTPLQSFASSRDRAATILRPHTPHAQSMSPTLRSN